MMAQRKEVVQKEKGKQPKQEHKSQVLLEYRWIIYRKKYIVFPWYEKSVMKAWLNMHTHEICQKICHEGLTDYAYTCNLPEKSAIKAWLNIHTHEFCHEGLTEYA